MLPLYASWAAIVHYCDQQAACGQGRQHSSESRCPIHHSVEPQALLNAYSMYYILSYVCEPVMAQAPRCMEVCYAVVGELLSSVRTLALLLWDACQLCVAAVVATLLALLRLSETLRLARLSAALTESSKAPARPACAAPLALRCSRSSSALHKLLLPPRLGAPHRLTVRGFGTGTSIAVWPLYFLWCLALVHRLRDKVLRFITTLFPFRTVFIVKVALPMASIISLWFVRSC